jgi:hypothetical protein
MATDTASILAIALGLLTRKIIVLISLGMAFSLFCWALYEHTQLALIIAGSFAVLVFLPVLFKGDSRAPQDGP